MISNIINDREASAGSVKVAFGEIIGQQLYHQQSKKYW